MRLPRSLLLAILALSASCVAPAQPIYKWHGYDGVLYAQAKAPENNEKYLEGLKAIIEQTEATKDKVPPGIYAEYGYALFTNGQLDDAITYYGKERDTWPESHVFMEKMIRNTERLRDTRPPTEQGPAAPLPETQPGAPTTGAAPIHQGGRS